MVKQCIKCNRLFEDILEKYDLCPECRKEEEEVLRDVKDYLWNNPGTTEAKLWELFGVTHKEIVKWLRDERIELTPSSKIKLQCLRCGSMIYKGRYCEDCQIKISQEMTELKASFMPKTDKKIFSMVKDSASAKDERMRFLQDAENKDFHDKF
jgi:predicted  nucleic acid-binding Zn-ribbon protein